MTELTHRTLKGFAFREAIGSGGFGTVYRAYQPAVDREVAIKVIRPEYANHPDFIRRFEAEAQIIARLEHPHIVPLYDFWRDPSGAYLVMRWLPRSLRMGLNEGWWDLETIVRLVEQIAAALAVAHRQHIVHRDIKPDNILLDEDRNAYLADFGIAKVLDVRTESGLSQQLAGSPLYISPEQIRSETVSPQTDLYSLGVVLYELLTGEKPFPDATTPTSLIYKHLNQPLPSVRQIRVDIPPAVDGVIQTATAKTPSERYPDAARLAAAFRAAAAIARPVSDQPLPEPLTTQELKVLRLMMDGCSNSEIAERLFLTPGTVKWYLKQIYSKLDVHGREQAIERARMLHLTDEHRATPIPPTVEGTVIPQISGEEAALPRRAVQNPYKGLQAFQEADAADFFGREALTAQLVNRLGESEPFARFLAVVGPSGSGKSSVVKAGLLPALRKGALPGSETWYISTMLPGAHPLEEVELALTRVAALADLDLLPMLRENERGLLRAARKVLPDNGSQLLLVIDQFEEVFTLVENPEEATHFLDSLYVAVTDAHSPLQIVITLRADFYDRPLMYPRFSEIVGQRTQTVTPLRPEEIEQAVVQPVQAIGVEVEAGLTAAIIAEVNEQPGALPLLQYALTELFEERDGNTLTKACYGALGGTLGALARRADEVYGGLNATEKSVARQLFLHLVTLGEGTEDTRRRALQSEILSVGRDLGIMQDVIDAFDHARLLTFDRDPVTHGPTIEVAHEALLREWKQLRAWLDESRNDVRLERILATSVAQWANASREKSYLLNGAQLSQFEVWASETRLALTGNEQEYLAASIRERTQQETREKQRQARESELQRRATNALRLVVAVLLIALLGASGLSIFALDQRNTAEMARKRAEHEASTNRSLVLAQNALENLQSGQTDLALMLALEAMKGGDPPPAAESALRAIAQSTGIRSMAQAHKEAVRAVAFSPDGQFAISASCGVRTGTDCTKGELVIWNVLSGKEMRRLVGHTDQINCVVYSPEGKRMFSGASDGTLIVWNADSTSLGFGNLITTYTSPVGGVMRLSMRPDGTLLAVGGTQPNVALINPDTGKLIETLEGHQAAVVSLAFGPDGKQLLSGSDDKTVILWDVEKGTEILQFKGHTASVVDVAFVPDQPSVLSASQDWTVRLWDVGTGEMKRSISSVQAIDFMALTPNGRSLLYDGGEVLVMDVTQWRNTGILSGSRLAATMPSAKRVAISANGKYAISGYDAGNIIIWNLEVSREIRRFQDKDLISDFAIRPDGQRIIVGTNAGDGLLLNIGPDAPLQGQLLKRLTGHQGLVFPIAYSPNGKRALLGSGNWLNDFSELGRKSLILWDVDEQSATFGQRIAEITGFRLYPRSIAFSLDGSRILVGTQVDSPKGDLLLIDAATGNVIFRNELDHDVSGIAWSIDGKRALTSSAGTKNITLWDIDSTSATFGKVIRQYETSQSAFQTIWGPQEATVLVANTTGNIVELNATSGQLIREYSSSADALRSGVWSLRLSPDQRYILAGYDNSTVVLWDYASSREIAVMKGHPAYVVSLAFAADGKTAFSEGGNLVIQWQVSEPTLNELRQWVANNRYTRDFTCAERAQYDITPLCPANETK